ncbi:MAG: CHAD domain-containing protein [Pirellulaceae bacterium]|jgi:CHAD domain-containing protein|nr:CHAD domain-containing protein [Pirellulaceae bacterium]
MSQECVLSVQPSNLIAAGDKWCGGVRPDQSAAQVARYVLEGRLQVVRERLPSAALESDKDVEHVHQLRIATRRAVEAVRLFARYIPPEASEGMRETLREIRRAADGARNLDVLDQLLHGCLDVSGADVVPRLREEIRRRREAAQQPILAMHERWVADDCDARVATMLAELGGKRRGKKKRSYARYVRPALRRVVRKFFAAADADLADEAALHRFRIAVKKLRYTMELVAVAFAPSFRKELYPQISILQELMGIVNDHAMGKAFFRDWSAQAPDPQQRLFLAGVMLAEDRAHRDVRQAFFTLWTPRFRGDLRQQFDAFGVWGSP